jgi:exonuclease III
MKIHHPIEWIYPGMSRRRQPLIPNKLTLKNLSVIHRQQGMLSVVLSTKDLPDPISKKAYLKCLTDGWIPANTHWLPRVTPQALKIEVPPKVNPTRWETLCEEQQITMTEITGHSKVITGCTTQEYCHGWWNPQQLMKQLRLNWHITSVARNHLMKAYNGNTPGCLSTGFPHPNLREHLGMHEHRSLVIVMHNTRSMQPSDTHMNQLIHSTPKAPDVVVLTETHQTGETAQRASKKWQAQEYNLHWKPKCSKANMATGVAIAHLRQIAGCKVVAHDPTGRMLAILIPLSRGAKLLLIGVYGPQKKSYPEQESLVKQILNLLQMARDQQHYVLLTGDWNALQQEHLDCNKPSLKHTSTPWLAEIMNNPYQPLIDPWRHHNPEACEYTYVHGGSTYRDRKDFHLVSNDLLPHVNWVTNEVWPMAPDRTDHQAIGLSIDLTSVGESPIWNQARAPPRDEYKPHHDEGWHTYKETIIENKNTWKTAPQKAMALLQEQMVEASEQAGVVIEKMAPKHVCYPYQDKRTKQRVHLIHRCNQALHPNFPYWKYGHKLRILQDLQSKLPARNQRTREGLLKHTAKTNVGLPERWQTTIPAIRREMASYIKMAADRNRKKAADKYWERINHLAEDYPKKLLWKIKEQGQGSATTAINALGQSLTTIPELTEEAQIHLAKKFAPPAELSPLVHPHEDPDGTTEKQRINRQQLHHVLATYAARTTQSQRDKLRALTDPTSALEVREVLQKIKRNSYAPGIPMVLFKELPDIALEPLARLVTCILRDPTQMSEEDLLAHLILLPKEDPQDLSKIRPITMCGAFYKIVAHIISSRVMAILETDSFLLESNVGFTPHGETHHLITTLQALFDVQHATSTSHPEHSSHLHALLVDLSEAYDRVPWYAMTQTLQHLGFPEAIIQWLHRGWSGTKTYIKFPQGLDDQPVTYDANRGIKQGCPLSPILFAIFNDTLLRWITQETEPITMGTASTAALGYADDMAFLSRGDATQLVKQVQILNEWEELTDQLLNTKKTQILTTAIQDPWEIYNPRDSVVQPIAKVETFKYLGVIVHSNPLQENLEEKKKLEASRIAKAMERLLKLKSLPLNTASKVAVIKSAIHTMIPYGAYAIAPKQLPVWSLQTLTNRVLKGGSKHQHMSNALSQHPTLGEQHPNIHQDLPFLVVAELHRILNTPNFAQHVLLQYLHLVQADHQWPHHPLDPATLHLPLNPKWDHSLIQVWRQWLQIPTKAVQPSFLNTSPELNPGGWTHFFSSSRFDYQTTRINREPWIIPEGVRQKLATMNVYNWDQLQASPQHTLSVMMLPEELQALRTKVFGEEERGSHPTSPPLPSPWDVWQIKPDQSLPPDSYTAGDGAANRHHMSAAWAVASPVQYEQGEIPSTQVMTQPVYGYLNSTWAESYALEGALIATIQNDLGVVAPPSQDLTSQPNHVQDNKSTLETFEKYMSSREVSEGHFSSFQQARPVWRRIRQQKERLKHLRMCWKKGHSTNADINAVDLLTERSLQHLPLEEAEGSFPDLNAITAGMDEFALLLTFPPQENLPIAHPNLPTPGRDRSLRIVREHSQAPSFNLTIRHDGTRSQLHTLWRHLLTREAGQQSWTYQFMTQGINTSRAQQGMKTFQKGYKVRMKAPSQPDPGINEELGLAQPITMAESTLIKRLRQGLWVVHTQIPDSDARESPRPAFRMCSHCHELATLHHVTCACARPDILEDRGRLQAYMLKINQRHPHLPKGNGCCTQEHHFNTRTPTNLANTRFRHNTLPQISPPNHQGENPKCLYAMLGLRKEWDAPCPKYNKLLIAAMRTTCNIIHTWMQTQDQQHLVEKSEFEDLVTPPREPTRTKPITIQPPRGAAEVSHQWERVGRPCQASSCTRQALPLFSRCGYHLTPVEKQRRRKNQSYTRNPKGKGRLVTHNLPISAPPIIISGGFGAMREQDWPSVTESDPPRMIEELPPHIQGKQNRSPQRLPMPPRHKLRGTKWQSVLDDCWPTQAGIMSQNQDREWSHPKNMPLPRGKRLLDHKVTSSKVHCKGAVHPQFHTKPTESTGILSQDSEQPQPQRPALPRAPDRCKRKLSSTLLASNKKPCLGVHPSEHRGREGPMLDHPPLPTAMLDWGGRTRVEQWITSATKQH